MSGGPNPSGLCRCGCGQPTPLATRTRGSLGTVRGEHLRYCHGHATLGPRQLDRYEIRDCGHDTPCWIWLGAIRPNGYGTISWRGRSRSVHAVFYEEHVGPIPEGLEIDHLCGVRACVNPEHLEPVTHGENLRRAAQADPERWMRDRRFAPAERQAAA